MRRYLGALSSFSCTVAAFNEGGPRGLRQYHMLKIQGRHRPGERQEFSAKDKGGSAVACGGLRANLSAAASALLIINSSPAVAQQPVMPVNTLLPSEEEAASLPGLPSTFPPLAPFSLPSLTEVILSVRA